MDKKKLRYYYWLFLEFFKKNNNIIIISFVGTLLIVIGIIILAPYFGFIISQNKRVIGYNQLYTLETLPEEIQEKIGRGLAIIKKNGEVVPLLAEKWELVNNNTTYRITLKNNLHWSNGDVVHAIDIKRIYERQFSLKNSGIIISRVDDKTLDFTFKTQSENDKPLITLPTYLTAPIINRSFNGIGGDYVVRNIAYRNGKIISLVLSPITTKQELPYLIYKFYDNDSSLVQAYKLGDIREFTTSKEDIISDIREWNNTKVEEKIDYSRLITLFFNVSNPEKNFTKEDGEDIKRALSSSIPYKDLETWGQIAKSPIAPNSWAYNDSIKPKSQDIDRAKQLFEPFSPASAPATFSFYTYSNYIDQAETIAKSIRDAGVNVKIEYIGFEKPTNFDLLLTSIKISDDPDQYALWHSTQTQNGNVTNYNNPRIDLLLEEGRNTLDVEERKKIYDKFQEVFMANPPASFLYFPRIFYVKRK